MGVLRARVGGQWVDIGGATDAVWVDTAAPADPNVELWYDTDAPANGPPVTSKVYSKTMTPTTVNSGGAGYADWFTIDAAVPVPAWATRFRIVLMMSYLLYQTAGGNIYGVRVALGGAVGAGWNFDDSSKSHFDINLTDNMAVVAPGTNQVLKVQASRIAGTGTWSCGTFGSTVGATIDWLA